MTRINTNVSSLIAQNTLQRSNADLNQALTRLSTGLRINTGKDDPAGLIASENLRSDITSIQKAISNSQRANQVIATADSALGQVSSLLNDIRGLVTESANEGALSDAQRAANQLQLDSSLEALNRIAQTTTFQGRRLLDGSLDFITQAGTNFGRISNLQIDQANLGATGSVTVDIQITAAATKAQVQIADIPSAVTPETAEAELTFNTSAVQSTGDIDIEIEVDAVQASTEGAGGSRIVLASGAEISIEAIAGADFDGIAGNLTIELIEDGGVGTSPTVTLNGSTLEIRAQNNTTTAQNIIDAIDAFDPGGGVALSAALEDGNGTDVYVTADAGANGALANGADATTAIETIEVTGVGGAAGNVNIQVVESASVLDGTPVVSGNADDGYVVSIGQGQTTTIAAITAAINGLDEVGATYAGSASYISGTDTSLSGSGITLELSNGSDAGEDTITISAASSGTEANGVSVTIVEAAGVGTTPSAAVDNDGNIVVTVDDDGTTTIAAIASAINGLTNFTASVTTSTGSGNYVGADDTPPTAVTLAGGVDGSGGISADVVLELSGADGSEVLSFKAGTSITQVKAAIDLVKDATGVEAEVDGDTLNLNSVGYGTKALVDIKVITEGSGASPAGTFTTAIGQQARDNGTDVVASVNGVGATGDGNSLAINTATLDMSTSVEANFTGSISFDITGGGALFQLGPDVVSNQQARLGISSVNTARLGGVNGKLFQLGTGGNASLDNDTTTAARIVEEAINQVTSLRGRLGAFQRTTLETNQQALNDTLVNLTDAESSIRDADFAAESAALTRAQILVQSGTTVLQIANSNPQNVLALLR